jgi:hypothetical protein
MPPTPCAPMLSERPLVEAPPPTPALSAMPEHVITFIFQYATSFLGATARQKARVSPNNRNLNVLIEKNA